MSFSIQQYPKLKEAIEKNNLVLFVGAGTSLNLFNTSGVKIGNWNSLINNILTHLKQAGHEVNHLERSLKTNDPLTVLSELEQFYNDIEKNSIYEFTNNYFSIDENKNDLEFHKKLFLLSPKIICTNYDKAFEIACPTLLQNNKIILRGNSAKIERLKSENEFLLKLHGCYSHENTMVLFNSDYKKLYESDEIDSLHLLTFLSNLFYNKTILFIGYGMGDEEINLIFNNIQKVTNRYSQKHYIISKDKIKEDLKSFLIHIPIDTYSEIQTIIDLLIELKNNFENENNKEKKEQQKQIETLTKELANSKNKNAHLINELFQEALDFSENKEYEKAISKYKQISRLSDFTSVYTNWGNSLSNLSKLKTGIEKEKLLLESFSKYEKAIIIDENNTTAYTNWGVNIYELSELKTEPEKEKLLIDSCTKLQKAILADENNKIAYNNWGVYLSSLSELKKGIEKELLLIDSCNKHVKAIQIDENFAVAYYNWGHNLYNLSTLKTGIEEEKLLLESCIKFEKSTLLDENLSAAFNNWGASLNALSKLKTKIKKEQLLLESCKKHEKAIQLDENNFDAFYKLGNSLMLLGINSKDKPHTYFKKAENAFIKSKKLNGNIYNLACLYAIQNKKENALFYLNTALEKNEIEAKYVEKDDDDWISYRKDPDFITLIEKYKSN